MTTDKITIRQAFIIFALTTLSPAIRLFPTLCAKYAGTAAWLAPVIGCIAAIFAVIILGAIYKKGGLDGLGGVMMRTLTKPVAKLLLAVYLLWTLLLFMLYVRYYAERLVSSLFTSTQPHFFIITMLAVVFMAARLKLTALARFSEVMLLVFAVVFAVFFISLVPVMSVHNIMPVTVYDAVPVVRASYPVVSVWGFVTLIFFLGGHIGGKKELTKKGLGTIAVLAPATVLMIAFVVGALGADAASRMPLPFFKVSKLIDIMQSFDRFEAVLATVWVIADFILITVFVFIIMGIAKELFGLAEPKVLAGPVVLLGYAGGLLVAADRYELETFSDSFAVHALNLTLCLVIPAVVLAIGKVRKKL